MGTIMLEERMAQHLALVAGRYGRTLQEYVEMHLRLHLIKEDSSYVDPVWEMKEGGWIGIRVPPGTPVLTVEEVNRLAWGDLE